jgi:Pentapeptide repeats (8 copies)
MDAETITAIGTALTAFGALLGGIVGIGQYFRYRTRRDKIAEVRRNFDAIVKSLASKDEVEKMAGAILLRRFFDPKTEVTIEGTPYAPEAINVIAAILRGQESGNFQKLLGDGLSYASTLQKVDLQKTNLRNVYLGTRRDDTNIDLKGADFYRSDLSGASLKGADARKAVFYQARMHDTILRNADLREANFFEADLLGANFEGSKLGGANFKDARNLPPEMAVHLKNDHWVGSETFIAVVSASPKKILRVFVSKPGCLDYRQEKFVGSVCSWLEAEGMVPEALERPDYPVSGALGEVQRVMSGCVGAVVCGFRALEVRDGVWRAGTADEQHVTGQVHATPWCQIEAGMAVMIGLPLLVVAEPDLSAGICDPKLDEHHIYRLPRQADRRSSTFNEWCAAVRERARVA